MSNFKFQWQSFKMENSAKDFLEKYISRIEKYADAHKISDDLIDDIKQSILEKLLDEKWEITQKQLVKIVNSIWEPEDIFSEDVMDIETVSKKENTKNKKYKPMLLWVCAWLAELMRIPVRVLRVLFIILIFWYTFWFWLYLIIFLIRLITDRDWTLSSLSSRIKRIFSRLWDWIRRIWKNTWRLIKWIRRIFVCGVLLCCIWMLCWWIWLMISDLTIGNQSFKMMFSIWSLIALWCLILSFSFWFIAWIFRIKWTPIKNRLAHFIALIIAIGWCIWLWAEWIWYIWMQRYTYNFPIDLWEVPTSWYVSIETMDRIDENKPKIYYELYRWDEFKAEFEYSFSAKNSEIAKEIYSKANMPTVSKNEKWRVFGWWENANLYDEIVPFNNPNIVMKITLPAWYQLDLNRSLVNRCPYGKYVYFDTDRDNFFCEWEIRNTYDEIDNHDLQVPELTAETAIETACRQDFSNFAKVIHPEKWVEFFPYSYLVWLSATIMMPSNFSSYNWEIFSRESTWPEWTPLKLSLNQYFQQYVCDKPFNNWIATTTTIIDSESLLARSDNLAHKLSPLVDEFNNPVFVHYTYEWNYQYEWEKSEDVVLVFELYKSAWKLVAVIHG